MLFALLGIMLTQHALNRLGLFTSIEQAIILFGSHFSLCMVNYFGHYQLFGFHLAPAFFLLLYVYLQDFHIRDLVLLCLTFCLGVLMAVYLAPFLLAMSLILVPVLLWPQIKNFGFRRLSSKIGPMAPLVVTAFATVLYLVQLRPYFVISSRFDAWDIDVFNRYSGLAKNLIVSPSARSLWYSPATVPPGYIESSYFPGYLLLGSLASTLILLGLHTLRNQTGRPQKREITSPLASPRFLAYCLAIFVSALALSWGPSWQSQHLSGWLPFSVLRHVVPGLGQARALGRFGMFLGLPLGVFLVTAVRSMPLGRRLRTAFCALALAALFIESLPGSFDLYPHEIDPHGTYQRVSEVLPENVPLLELPILGSGRRAYIFTTLAQMGGSTVHWGRLVTGYGAHHAPEQGELTRLDRLFRNQTRAPRQLLAFARRNDIEFLLIHMGSYDGRHRALWRPIIRRATVLVRHHRSVLIQLSPQ